MKIKKVKLFYKIYFSALAAALIIIAVTLGVLYNWLIAYEKSSPQGYANQVVKAIENNDMNVFSGSSEKLLNDFEKVTQIEEFLAKRCDGKAIRVEKDLKKYTTKAPVFTVFADSKELFTMEFEQSGKKSFGMDLWQIANFSTADYALQELNIYVPSQTEVLINKKPADSQNATISEKAQVSEYLDASSHVSVPEMRKITVKGFFVEPQVEAIIGGKAAFVNKISDGEYRVSAMSESQLKQMHEKKLEEFAKTYATYTSDDGSFSKLSKYLIKGTQTYNDLRTMEVYWFTNHDRYDFKNFKTDNYIAYDQNSFSCHASFDYYVYRGKKEYHYPSGYTFYFTVIDGQYKLCSMTLD